MTGGWVTQADRARWQLRAARELTVILGDCGGLPPISWTVAPGGAVLAGRVNGLAPAGQVRATLAAWREALALDGYREWPGGGGTIRLRACGQRHEVRVRISATVSFRTAAGRRRPAGAACPAAWAAGEAARVRAAGIPR